MISLKKLFLSVLVIALLAAPVLWSTALNSRPAEAAPARQANPPQRSITVTGYGTAYGAPDMVRMGLGVDAVNADIMAALEDANIRMNAVTATLIEAGVEADDIQTSYFSVYQEYSDPSMGSERPTLYHASTIINVIVRDPQIVGELLSSAVAAGANMVNYVEFAISDQAALESEARELAVADARVRAEQLAGLLGLTVGEPLTIVEGTDSYGMPRGLGGGGGGAGSPAISQGTLSVNMTVTITFAAQ